MKATLLIILFALQCISTAKAALITYEFSGQLNRATSADCQTYSSSGRCNSWIHSYPSTSNFFNGEDISLGDHFSGQFTYDTSASYSLSSDGFQAVYLGAVPNYQLEVNGILFPSLVLPVAGTGNLSIVDGRRGSDSFFLSQWLSGADWFATTYISLQDRSGLIYNSFDVPDSVSLSDFSYRGFYISFLRRSDGDQLRFYGDVSNLERVSVPEPSALLLFLTSLFLVLIRSGAIKTRLVGRWCIGATENKRTV